MFVFAFSRELITVSEYGMTDFWDSRAVVGEKKMSLQALRLHLHLKAGATPLRQFSSLVGPVSS